MTRDSIAWPGALVLQCLTKTNIHWVPRSWAGNLPNLVLECFVVWGTPESTGSFEIAGAHFRVSTAFPTVTDPYKVIIGSFSCSILAGGRRGLLCALVCELPQYLLLPSHFLL